MPGDWDGVEKAIDGQRRRLIENYAIYRDVSVYLDKSGYCCGRLDTHDGYVEVMFSLQASGSHNVAVWQVMPGIAEVNLLDSNGEFLTRFISFVDDPHMYPWYSLDAIGEPARYNEYHIGAVAVDLTVYDSEEEWDKAQEPGAISPPTGPRLVLSPYAFTLHDGRSKAEEASPIAMFKAVIKEIEVVTIHLTGIKWYKAIADCGFDVALALPIHISPAPHLGSVVDGEAFMTGTSGNWGPPVDQD
ncbi:hypothetical protein C3B44_11455 [Corynebacterium yudongzhengii]|uniref:Uncharacterized protein n=1 Tax=Corynebacterium yudongzhengii TaxID=2080740 RepID=A0A2U1T4L2_9CORY|nr:hypothetical protein [Corynebacterium yudongzhengii]AWB82866.1 hypothetical protein C3B44_11455 [Corynebacterium yudongzhengii]PWC00939.1 hypothetical protein DF222_10220 [Corynebacterium yudongzhengii]